MKNISGLIQKGEGFSVEFKLTISSAKKAAKEIAAFSNTKGGTLFIGVDDRGKPVGVHSIEKEKEALITASQIFCSPPVPLDIQSVSVNDKLILIVKIHEGNEKPYLCLSEEDKERIYIRVKDKNLLASRDVIRSMKNESTQRKRKAELGKNEKKLIAYLKENEKITLNEFKQLANLSKRRASKILFELVKEGLIRNHTMEKEKYYTSSFE